MEGILIHLDYCLTPTNKVTNAVLLIHQDKIVAIGGFSAFSSLENYQVIELPQCYAAPGLIDTHIYGAGGYDCMHADKDTNIAPMSAILARHGVTSFLPTTQSADRKRLHNVIQALAGIHEQTEPLPGAIPVGIHIEGPYLNKEKPGAHPVRYLREIDLTEVEDMLETGGGWVRILTFAPELNQATELTRLLVKNQVVASLGHTKADEAQILRVIEAGANRCSHLYNGMELLQQRKIGLAAIAMTDKRMWVELISDGVHIHPRMIDLACRCKQIAHVICISNSTEAAGCDRQGSFRLGEETIHVQNRRALLDNRDCLAGGISFLDENFRSFLSSSHLSQTEALSCFTLNAAHSIHLHDRGELKPGKRADIVIFNHQHEVMMTIVAGRIAYAHESLDLSGLPVTTAD